MAQAKAAFDLDRFKSEVLSQGLARTNRFEVILGAPVALKSYSAGVLTKTSLFCEVSNFPPLSLNVRQLRIFGPNFQRPIASDYGGDGLSMIFHVDREMVVKSFFDDWIELIVNNQNWTVQYPEDYQATIYVRQLDEQNNVTYEIELLEAFPRSMNIMELNQSAQNQTHRLNVIFAYRYWRKTKDYKYYSPEKTSVPVVPFRIQPIIPPAGSGVQWNAGNEQGSFTENSGGSDFGVGA